MPGSKKRTKAKKSSKKSSKNSSKKSSKQSSKQSKKSKMNARTSVKDDNINIESEAPQTTLEIINTEAINELDLGTRKDSTNSPEKTEPPVESSKEKHNSLVSSENVTHDSSQSTTKVKKRVKKHKRIKVKRRKHVLNHENEEKQQQLRKKYDKMVEEKIRQEELAATQAAFAEYSAIGQSSYELMRLFINKLYFVLLLGKVFGRYPFQHEKNESSLYVFRFSMISPFAIYFLVINICLTLLFLAGTWSVFSFWMHIPVGLDFRHLDEYAKAFLARNNMSIGKNSSQTITEAYLHNRPEAIVYTRHIVFFVMTWCYLLHNVVSGWHFWKLRVYIVKYFNFWLQAINTMYMDVTQSAILPALVCMGITAGVTVIFIIVSFLKLIPSIVSLPAFIAIVLGRDFYPELLSQRPKGCAQPPCLGPSYEVLYFIGQLVQIFLIMSANFYVILCLTICKFLKNSLTLWNGRVYSSLLRGGDYIQSEEGRSTYALLFKDHCTLLDLVEATDRVFTFVLESFIGLSVLSLPLEMYFIIRTGQYGYAKEQAEANKYFIRPHDWLAGLILTVQHFVILMMVLRMSAGVGEEAMAGLEIIRRKTMLGRKTDEELYFMLSMFSSYTSFHAIGLSGGGFFVCNKDLIIGVVATIISYFTVVFQFEPKLDFSGEYNDDISRKSIEMFIKALEKARWQ